MLMSMIVFGIIFFSYVGSCLSGFAPVLLLLRLSPCSLGLSATNHQYFSLTTNQPSATSQQYFSLRTNQHQPSATSQMNR
jgi:hypothetical protein